MAKKNLLVLLFVGIALAALTATMVSATHDVDSFGHIVRVEVNGITVGANSDVDFAEFSGQRVPILVVFEAVDDFDALNIGEDGVVEEVRIKAWISGERENAIVSDRFDVLEGRTYSRFFLLDIPSDLDRDLDESRRLEIVVESRSDGTADEEEIDFTVQRESFGIEILAVNLHSEVKAGDALIADVVIKNVGRQFADDTFLTVRIPELGLETSSYFGDLSPLDQDDPDKEDAVERRVFLRIPADVSAGLYTVVFEAFNSDSFVTLEKKVLVGGAGDDTMVVSGTSSRKFAVGETEEYTLTLVNRGNTIRVYELFVESDGGLDVDVEPVVVVPAGSSRTVTVFVESQEEGQGSFTINVLSDGKQIDAKTFRANVVEEDGRVTVDSKNATVLLTIILAIVFIVLLVVLIVLLTRKPQKSEEFGESYY